MPGRTAMRHLLAMILLALMLSGCVGFDVNMRGWQVKGFASLPLETPLIEHRTRVEPPAYAPQRVIERRASPRVIYRDRTSTVTRRESCTPPHHLMYQSPYYNPDHVRRFRDLQRWVARNCS